MQLKSVFDATMTRKAGGRRLCVVVRAETPQNDHKAAVEDFKSKAREAINTMKTRKTNMETMRFQNINKLHESIKQIVMDELSYVKSLCEITSTNTPADTDQELAKTLEPLLKNKHDVADASPLSGSEDEGKTDDDVFVTKF